jgi:hypothetical protein
MTPKVTYYQFPDGHCSVAENNVWISALFVSIQAAISWADDWDAAELAFKALNPPTGKGENFVPERKNYDPHSHSIDT